MGAQIFLDSGPWENNNQLWGLRPIPYTPCPPPPPSQRRSTSACGGTQEHTPCGPFKITLFYGVATHPIHPYPPPPPSHLCPHSWATVPRGALCCIISNKPPKGDRSEGGTGGRGDGAPGCPERGRAHCRSKPGPRLGRAGPGSDGPSGAQIIDFGFVFLLFWECDFRLSPTSILAYKSYGKSQTGESEKRRSETLCFPVSNEGPSGPWTQKSLI